MSQLKYFWFALCAEVELPVLYFGDDLQMFPDNSLMFPSVNIGNCNWPGWELDPGETEVTSYCWGCQGVHSTALH